MVPNVKKNINDWKIKGNFFLYEYKEIATDRLQSNVRENDFFMWENVWIFMKESHSL